MGIGTPDAGETESTARGGASFCFCFRGVWCEAGRQHGHGGVRDLSSVAFLCLLATELERALGPGK